MPRIDAGALGEIAARLDRAAAELRATGLEVQWLRSVATVAEETCFCFFSAPGPGAVATLNERAGLGCDSVGEILTIEPGAR